MKRTKAGKAGIYIVLAIMIGLMAQSCYGGKKCGCMGDIMGNYKSHKKGGY